MKSFISTVHRLRGRIIAAMVTLLLVSVSASAASICEQTFTVFGKTIGANAILAFREEIGGECGLDNLFLIMLNVNVPGVVLSTYSPKGVGHRVTAFLNEVGTEYVDTVAEEHGRFTLNDSVYFTLPPEDTTFGRKHGRLTNEGQADAAHWRRECPVNCQDYPNFVGTKATLLYEYKRGLYKNYTISQCLWYSKSNILVIITNQPMRAVGLDTMHGLLIYHLDRDGTGGES